MTDKQILEDAIIEDGIEAELLDIHDPYGSGYFGNIERLTKFAELTKANHELQSLKTIAEIRDIFNLHTPMMDELPELIKQELTKAHSQWIDCSVELPKNESIVMTNAGSANSEYCQCFFNNGKWQELDCCGDFLDTAPTHWHELPLPPNAQQERN